MQTKLAPTLLTKAKECISDRASERDTEAERSMNRAVFAFNVMFGKDLSVTEGWQFMELIKMARSAGGDYREDDFVDGAAYAALAGEAAYEAHLLKLSSLPIPEGVQHAEPSQGISETS